MSEIQKALASRYLTMPLEQFRNVFEAKLGEKFREECDGSDDSDDDRLMADALLLMFRICNTYNRISYDDLTDMVSRMLSMTPEQRSEFHRMLDGWEIADSWGLVVEK